jgi:TldD protein
VTIRATSPVNRTLPLVGTGLGIALVTTLASAAPAPGTPPGAPPPPRAVATQPPAKPALGTPSRAVTDDIIDAVAEEMNRALTSLEIPGAPKPYHVSYKITEVEVNDAVASLGYTTSKKERHFVNLEARVRVGNFDLDNGNFVVPQAEGLDGVAGITLPLEATPKMARRAAWLVTDAAYKEALMQLRAKLDARSSGRGQGAPSWTPQKAVVSEEAVLVPVLEPLADIDARARALSAAFRDDPHIREARVAFTSFLERRWYVNSEGTSVADTRRVSGVVIAATSQADDGQEIAQYYTHYGQTAHDLPGDKELLAEAKKLSDTLAALQKAPVLQRYAGPVLFEGAGAAGMVRHTLAPHLGGTPLPEGLRPQEAKQFGGALADKVGLKVLASNLSIIDDPTAAALLGTPVIGGYKLDDEGTPAQKVEVVKNGTLSTLLTSRTPAAKGGVSNGHARRTAPGGMFHGSTTNLSVVGKGGIDRKALVKKLLAAAKGEGLEYGLIVRRFDDAAVTAAPEYSRRELIQMISNADLDLPPPSILAYRVYPNGKEELVRGVQLAEVPIRAWRDVIAVGNKPIVYNYLAAAEPYLEQKISGVDEGFVPSSGIESAIATPDLLFQEIDATGTTAGTRAAPAVPRPAESTPPPARAGAPVPPKPEKK